MLKVNYTKESLEIILFKIFRIGFSSSKIDGKWCIFYIGIMRFSIGTSLNWKSKPKTITRQQMFDA